MSIVRKHLHAVEDARPARRAYSAEFKTDAVQRVAAGTPLLVVARDLGVARNTLKAWIRKVADADRAPSMPVDPEPVDSGIIAAAASGDRRAVLVAVRTELAASIARGVAARDLPAHVRMLNETMREIDHLGAGSDDESSPTDIPDAPFNPEEI